EKNEKCLRAARADPTRPTGRDHASRTTAGPGRRPGHRADRHGPSVKERAGRPPTEARYPADPRLARLRRARATLTRTTEATTTMTGFADYEAYDALGLAELVRRGKVTPTQLLDAAIARVEARNPMINAVVLPLYDYARKAIADGLPDGPLSGVPFLVKDL